MPPSQTLLRIPDDTLLEIFKRFPCEDVVRCSMVCKRWSSLIDSYHFWVAKCNFDGYLCDSASTSQFHKVPIHHLKRLIVKRAFNRNLLDDDYSIRPPKIDSRWTSYKKDMERVECPPCFVEEESSNDELLPHMDESFTWDLNELFRPDLHEDGVQFESCLASSAEHSIDRSITIDLTDYGLSGNFLNRFKPTIIVSEYYSNRSDGACFYRLKSRLVHTLHSNHDVSSDKKIFETTINQWKPSFWRKAEHVFRDYSDGKTILCLRISGSSRQYWSGNSGVKTAGTSVVVKLEFNRAERN